MQVFTTLLMCFLLTIRIALSAKGQVIYSTVPNNTDSGPAYVFTDDGTLNISLYCEVISNNMELGLNDKQILLLL